MIEDENHPTVIVEKHRKGLLKLNFDIQLLEKEKVNLESEMKNMLKELVFQKNQNNRMHDEITRLELGLEHNKQYQIERATYQKALAETTQMYEQKINDLVIQVDDEHARSVGLEELVISLQKALTDNQSSLQVSCRRVEWFLAADIFSCPDSL
ncbi:kinesin-like protein KIN-UC [Tanacetum coccineum]